MNFNNKNGPNSGFYCGSKLIEIFGKGQQLGFFYEKIALLDQ
jgi:hypothetical protein